MGLWRVGGGLLGFCGTTSEGMERGGALSDTTVSGVSSGDGVLGIEGGVRFTGPTMSFCGTGDPHSGPRKCMRKNQRQIYY